MMESVIALDESRLLQDKLLSLNNESERPERGRQWYCENWIHTQFRDDSEVQSGAHQDDAPSQSESIAFLRQHKKRLETELTSLKDKELETVSNYMPQHLIHRGEHHKRLQQLKKTLAFVRSQRAELSDRIAKEKEFGNVLNETNSSLKEKVSHVGERIQSDTNSSIKAVLVDMRAEINDMSKTGKAYKKVLIQLLKKSFPLPSVESELPSRPSLASKSALNHSRSYDESNLCSLEFIIRKLVEQTLNSPADPYVTLDETMWPEHIEFLLRSQIIRKHPQDSFKIKLIPFHL